MKKFNHLNIPQHWEQYWSKYPNGYSILESLIDWVSQVDDMVDNQNHLNETVETYGNRLDDFIRQFDTNLQSTVSDTLGEWQDSGFLNMIINEALETKYHEMNNRLTEQLDLMEHYKLTRGENESITSAMLSPEIRNMIADGEFVWNVNTSDIENGAVTIPKTDFIKVSSNLIKNEEVVYGKNFDNATGELEDSGNFSIFYMIKIKPSTDYVVNNVLKVGRYDAEGNFLSQLSTTNGMTIRAGANTHYFTLVVQYYEEEAQLNLGDELHPYEPYYFKVGDFDLHNLFEKKEEQEEQEAIDILTFDKFLLSTQPKGDYSQDTLTGETQYTRGQLLSRYNNEIKNEVPSYVSEHVWGNDHEGNPLVYYRFKPETTPKESEETKFPKIVLVSGVHGEERAGVYNLFYAMKEIATNWQSHPDLEFLRWNVEIIVAPIVNPTGYDLSSRKNSNGIDIARNFSEGFRVVSDTESQTYGGTQAFSERESQFVRDLLQNNDDIIYFGSAHNMWSAESFIWNASATQLQVHLGKVLVSKLTQKWRKEYDWFPQETDFFAGYSDMGSPNGSESKYAASLGVQASTIEMSSRIGFNENESDSFSDIATTLGTEMMIHWLVLMLKENIEFYNSL